jgi:D-alanyl-D-alanine carboxypeptidase (penicillin-binding protein 5/6)
LIIGCGALFYVASFFFSNAGLSPSNQSTVISGTMQTTPSGSQNFLVSEENLPDIKANSFEVVDMNSNTVLISRRPNSSLLVASLTKLMTTWIVLNYGQLADTYEISEKDTKSFSPSLGLVKGDKVLVSDLLNAMLIGSANDAAISLSHYIEGKQNKSFIELMNSEVNTLKLEDTRFSNPNGFDSDTNYSSSNDLKQLVSLLLQRKVFDSTSRSTKYTFSGSFKKNYSISSTNELIAKYSDLYAIKTGFTPEAQGSMVNLLKLDRKEYLIIVLGSPNRESDTLKLRDLVINSKLGNR